jgi:hypothetical protein
MDLGLFPDHPELFALITDITHTLGITIIPTGFPNQITKL